MQKKKNLTNEELTKLFKNPFDLVNHAIDVAKHLVEAGHELTDVGDKNTATVILRKVLKDRQDEEKNEDLIEFEERESVSEDKDVPDPLLQAI